MKILLTNDDGIDAYGINALYKALSKRHETYIIAPDGERSGCSNAFTIHNPIKIRRHDSNRYSITGYPADCSNIGIHGDFIPDIDIIISGINHGPNIGDDIFFSGTVAGARTAFIFGKTGIAVSLDSHTPSEERLDEAARFIANHVDGNPGLRENPVFININYPDIPEDRVNGIMYTNHCRRIYRDSYHRTDSDEAEMTFQLRGVVHSVGNGETDYGALQSGYVSITPISIDCTDYTSLEKLREPEAVSN